MGVCMSIDEDTLQIACGAEAMAKHRNRKRLLMEVLGAEAKVHQLLHRMPGRLCSNGAADSSCLFSKQGRKGINQDTLLVWEEFAAQANTVFCGVFDGHGPSGHVVARKVRDSLPVLLALPLHILSNAYVRPPACKSCNGCDQYSTGQEDDDHDHHDHHDHTTMPVDVASTTDSFAAWKEKFLIAYKLMDRNLKTHPKVDCFDSGTTAVTMVLQGNDLMVASVGDSRAILARRSNDGSLTADQLTIDFKPNLPGELERIRRCKGRVFALDCEPEVPRVWMPYSDAPGLAMARALGDFCLKEYGLSEVPEVAYRRLMEEDEFVILATDGIWDVLSNEDAIRIVASSFPKEDAAKNLVEAAVKRWKRRYGSWRTDDCSVVCYFFKHKSQQNNFHITTPMINYAAS